MNDKDEILKLKDGESYIVPESDYGKAEIWLKHNRYFLFYIPTYGGPLSFVESYDADNIDNLIKTYESWT